MTVEEHEIAKAREIRAVHIPSLITHQCLTCPDHRSWPCPPYRGAEATLILAGRLQPEPLRPSV